MREDHFNTKKSTPINKQKAITTELELKRVAYTKTKSLFGRENGVGLFRPGIGRSSAQQAICATP